MQSCSAPATRSERFADRIVHRHTRLYVPQRRMSYASLVPDSTSAVSLTAIISRRAPLTPGTEERWDAQEGPGMSSAHI